MIELQKIDCNCSDCIHMLRDGDKFRASLDKHNKWSLDYFNKIKENLVEAVIDWDKRGYPDKANNLRKEIKKMRYQFNKKEVSINYGKCDKLDKDVTFIPNTCQLDTQVCFKHRRS